MWIPEKCYIPFFYYRWISALYLSRFILTKRLDYEEHWSFRFSSDIMSIEAPFRKTIAVSIELVRLKRKFEKFWPICCQARRIEKQQNWIFLSRFKLPKISSCLLNHINKIILWCGWCYEILEEFCRKICRRDFWEIVLKRYIICCTNLSHCTNTGCHCWYIYVMHITNTWVG